MPILDQKKHSYNPSLQVWDKQKWETPKQYNLFTVFRDYGPDRTIPKIFNKNNKNNKNSNNKIIRIETQTAYHYSNIYDWIYRCSEYDAYIEKKARKENERRIINMYKKYANIGLEASKLGETILKEYKKEIRSLKKKKQLNNLKLTLTDLMRFLDKAREAEVFGLRAETFMPAINENTLNSAEKEDLDFNMTEEDKEETALLMNKIMNKKGVVNDTDNE